jgi:hypothetical protein
MTGRTMAANAVLTIAMACCAYASYAAFEADRASRIPAATFAERFAMPLRRPEVVKSLDYAPSGDFADDLIAETTLRDVLLPVNLRELEPKAVTAWIQSVETRDLQLTEASEVMLDALSQRPGWPYHATLLGQLVYTRDARALSPDLVRQYRRWSVPLYAGVHAAPNDRDLWQFLALSYIQTWPDLAHEHAPFAGAVLRNAFDDPEFVRTAFGQAAQIVGTDPVIAALPDSPLPLRAAFEQLATAGQVDAAWRVYQRWDAAEWRQRKLDLDRVESVAARADVTELRRVCRLWLSAHSVRDYDSAAARAQVARLLDRWPASDVGRWPSDPRTDAIAYLLAGRRDSVEGAVLLRAAAPLSGMPAAMQAQLHVVAADIIGAETIARAADSFGSFEWTPYVLDLSRYWLQHGSREKARAALTSLSPASRPECESTIVRAEAGDGSATEKGSGETTVQGGRARVPLCLPTPTPATVTLTLLDGPPVIVDYGWDRARSGSMLLSRPGQAVAVALPPMQGFRAATVSCIPASAASTISVGVTAGGS